MPKLHVDAIARRDTHRPFVRLFLSVSEDSSPVRDLLPNEFKVEYLGPESSLQVAELYPEAYMPGRYVAVMQTAEPEGTDPEEPVRYRVVITRPGGSVASTMACLAPLHEEIGHWRENSSV